MARKDGVDGKAGITAGDQRFAGVVVHAALVAEFALGVKNKKMRSRRGAISARNLLRLAVIQVGKIEMTIRRANLHLLERIAEIRIAQFVEADGVGTIGLDGDEGDASIAVVGRKLLEASFVKLRRGAMVAREGDDKNFAGGVFGQAVRLPINAGKAKIRRGRTDGQRGGPPSSDCPELQRSVRANEHRREAQRTKPLLRRLKYVICTDYT